MAQTKAKTSSPAANGVEKKKKEKHMPKALQRKIEDIEQLKTLQGFSLEEVLFDGEKPCVPEYSYLPKGNVGLTRSARMRTRNNHKTYFTVYDSSTYVEKGFYIPSLILSDVERDAAKAAEARKRKADKKMAQEAASKKKGPKKGTGNNNKTAAGNKRTKKTASATVVLADTNGTKGAAPGKSIAGNTTADESAPMGALNGVVDFAGRPDEVAGGAGTKDESVPEKSLPGENGIGNSNVAGGKTDPAENHSNGSSVPEKKEAREGATHEDDSAERIAVESVGENVAGHSDGVAGDKAGPADIVRNDEGSDAKMEMDHGDSLHEDHSEEHVGGENASGHPDKVAVNKASPAEPVRNEGSDAKNEMDREDANGSEGGSVGYESAEEELARETGDPMDDIRDGDGNQVAAGEKAGTEAGSPDVSDH